MRISPKATFGSVLVLLLAPTLLAAHEPDTTEGAAGKFKVMHSFDGSDAQNPQGWYLVQGPNNKLYGVSPTGGAFNAGTVYEVNGGGSVRLLHAFSGGAEGEQPQGLALDDRGNLVGVTTFGGSPECACGIAFRISKHGTFKVLHQFSVEEGGAPAGHLVFKDGYFYGTTQGGGPTDAGTIYRMSPSGEVTVVHAFENTGNLYAIGLSLGSDGALYGATAPSSAYPHGIVFRSTTEGDFAILHVFDGVTGSQPLSVPEPATDGNLYGVTPFGGEFGAGVVYRIDAGGTYSILHSFPIGTGPAYPFGKLEQGSNGRLYGTGGGGPDGYGTLFEVTLGGEVRTLYEFQYGFDGYAGTTGLTERSPGVFFGISPSGGSLEFGNIYRFRLSK